MSCSLLNSQTVKRYNSSEQVIYGASLAIGITHCYLSLNPRLTPALAARQAATVSVNPHRIIILRQFLTRRNTTEVITRARGWREGSVEHVPRRFTWQQTVTHQSRRLTVPGVEQLYVDRDQRVTTTPRSHPHHAAW